MQVASFFDGFVDDQLCTVWYHEVLLEDTEQFPLTVTIIWVQEEGQVASDICLVKVNTIFNNRWINWIQVEQTQTVLGFNLVTRDIDIIKGRSQCEVCKWHLVATAWTNEPALVSQPCIWNRFLLVVFKDLLEQTKVVVQTNPIPCQTKAWDRVDKAGCQTSQTTVTKWWFQFHFFDFDQVFTSIWQFFFNIVVKTQVDQVVRQEFTDQELSWDVVNFFLTSI